MVQFSWRFPFIHRESFPVCSSVEDAIDYFAQLQPGETKIVEVAFPLTEEIAFHILNNATWKAKARGMNGGQISPTRIRIRRW